MEGSQSSALPPETREAIFPKTKTATSSPSRDLRPDTRGLISILDWAAPPQCKHPVSCLKIGLDHHGELPQDQPENSCIVVVVVVREEIGIKLDCRETTSAKVLRLNISRFC